MPKKKKQADGEGSVASCPAQGQGEPNLSKSDPKPANAEPRPSTSESSQAKSLSKKPQSEPQASTSKPHPSASGSKKRKSNTKKAKSDQKQTKPSTSRPKDGEGSMASCPLQGQGEPNLSKSDPKPANAEPRPSTSESSQAKSLSKKPQSEPQASTSKPHPSASGSKKRKSNTKKAKSDQKQTKPSTSRPKDGEGSVASCPLQRQGEPNLSKSDPKPANAEPRPSTSESSQAKSLSKKPQSEPQASTSKPHPSASGSKKRKSNTKKAKSDQKQTKPSTSDPKVSHSEPKPSTSGSKQGKSLTKNSKFEPKRNTSEVKQGIPQPKGPPKEPPTQPKQSQPQPKGPPTQPKQAPLPPKEPPTQPKQAWAQLPQPPPEPTYDWPQLQQTLSQPKQPTAQPKQPQALPKQSTAFKGRTTSNWFQSQSRNIKPETKNQIEAVAQDSIDRLADAKEYVSIERIEQMVLNYYHVDKLKVLGVRHIEHLQCVTEHVRTQARVNAYIEAFLRIRAVATLHELHECLREYTPDKRDFESLKLGPITKQPLVYQYFLFPPHDPLLKIETRDVLEHLKNYLSEKDLWTSQFDNVVRDDFMTYMNSIYEVVTPYALGVRITSCALLIHVLKKSQRDQTLTTRTTLEACRSATEEEIESVFQLFISSLNFTKSDICERRQDLMKLPPRKAVQKVFSRYHMVLSTLMNHHKAWLSSKEIRRLEKKVSQIKTFSDTIKGDSLLEKALQFALCCSAEEDHLVFKELLGLNEVPSQADAGHGTEANKMENPRPSIAAVVAKIQQYMERCFLQGHLSLYNLCRIEDKLLEDYEKFPTFTSLSNTSFLHLITTNNQIKAFLAKNEGMVLGMQPEAHATSVLRPSLQDLHDFINQSTLLELSMESKLEKALCWHYQVKQVKHLGHASVQSLQSGAKSSQRKHKHESVFYESALCAKESVNLFSVGKVGLLGPQTKEAALVSLTNCPLLEDMAEWTQWDLVFRPELGELKDFVRKHGGLLLPDENGRVRGILALETRPGKLVKLAADTSNDAFTAGAAAGDVIATCGHLVSLITLNKGVVNTPLALLGNHLKTGLLKIQASQPTIQPDESCTDQALVSVGQFVVRCLTRLPLVICQAVADQVFLDPLTCVVGQSKSRNLLCECVSRVEEENRLQVLGVLLGMNEWTLSYHRRLQPPTLSHQTDRSTLSNVPISAALLIDSDLESSSSSSEVRDFLSDLSDEEKEENEEEVEEEENVAKEEVDEEESCNEEKSSTSGEDIFADMNKMFDDGMEENEEKAGSEGTEEEKEDEEEDDNPYLAVINDIRRTEFGINVKLSDEGQKLMEKQQERQGRSLDRLSDELYSKDSHFVLELIQNADDNSYDNDVIPALKFVVDEEKISVHNNEVGFQELNVRAICDVGKSTKGKHKAGYIGQKGIGFKSVFRVTDKPAIHSGGYHLMFDKSTGPIGYILPHLISEDTDTSNKWGTSIILPLKDEVQQSSKLRQLAARFQDVHPSLLLFLHRLRSITILNKIGGYKVKMERRDLGDNVIEVSHTMSPDMHNTKTDRWLVVERTLDASKLSLQAKSGVEVESTKIALAFPLHEVESLPAQALPPKQPVFAFLPLRTYGFRFVLQGDFDVPSSREDICHDSLWNQWLQGELHKLFADALEVFRQQPHLSVVEAVCLFIKFIPLEDEVLDFFRPVASRILQCLRSQPCLPTAAAAPGAPPEWRLPSQLVLITDHLLQQIASSQLLQTQLGLSYLHPDVGAKINPSLLTSLGVQTLTTSHLIELGRALSSQLIQASLAERDGIVGCVAKWFSALYRSMDDINIDKKMIESVKELPLLPLSNGDIVSLSLDGIFFPLDEEERRKTDKRKDLLLSLEQDINTVSTQLFSTLDEVTKPQVWRMLEMLGVRKLYPDDIIHHHILPSLHQLQQQQQLAGAPVATPKSAKLLVSYLVYIKEELDRQPQIVSMETLRPLAIVKTTEGFQRPSEESVHFPVQFLNKINLSKDLPGYNWVLVDPVYLERSKTHPDIQSWHRFLSKLGVTDIPAVIPKAVTLTHQNIHQSAWVDYTPLLPDGEPEFTLMDYECPELISLITANSQPNKIHQQMQVLFDVLDAYWESDYMQYVSTSVVGVSGRTVPEVETSFAMTIKQLRWVPYVKMNPSLTGNPFNSSQVEHGQCPGRDLFLQSSAIKRLLAHHVPYLDPLQPPRGQLTAFLQVKNTLTADLLKAMLIRWSTRSDAHIPQRFTTSLSHMKAVYSFLHDNLPPKQLQDLFHEHPVIYVPVISPGDMSDPQHIAPGQMLARAETRWDDPSKMFAKYKEELQLRGASSCIKSSLCLWYGDMESLMKHSARITPQPTEDEKAELILALTSSHLVNSIISDLLQIYTRLGEAIEYHQSEMQMNENESLPSDLSKLIKKVKQHAILPSKSKGWKKVADHPLIANDKQMEKLFSSKEGVNFLITDPPVTGRRHPKRQQGTQQNAEAVIAFYTCLGVETLSEVMTTEFVTESYRPCPSLYEYINSLLPYIQTALYHIHPDIYESHVQEGIVNKMTHMKFVQVGQLEVVYRLKPFPDIATVLGETCKMKDNEDEFAFYIHKDQLSNKHDINKELAAYFSLSDKSCSTEIWRILLQLMPLVGKPSSRVLRDLELEELPVEEVPWVPPPVRRPPSPPPPPPLPVIERPTTPVREHQGEGGAACWPPRSDPVKATKPGSKGGSNATSIWPPPAPAHPPPRPDFTSLPPHLRPPSSHLTQASSGTQPPEQASSGTQPHQQAPGVTQPQRQASGTKLQSHSGSDVRETQQLSSGTRAQHESPDVREPQQLISSGDREPPQLSAWVQEAQQLLSGDNEPQQEPSSANKTQQFSSESVSTAESVSVSSKDDDSQTKERNDEQNADSAQSRSQLPTEGPQEARENEPAGETHDGGVTRSDLSRDTLPLSANYIRRYRQVAGDSKHQRLWFDVPEWSYNDVEETLEEQEWGSRLPEELILDEEQMDASTLEKLVGRWGEQLVYNYLLCLKDNPQSEVVEVNWVNDEEERGDPYDLDITLLDPATNSYNHVYIEVKATCSDRKALFPISARQFELARDKGPNYHLYRVYNAGKKGQVRLTRVENLAAKMESKMVRLCLVI